MDEILEENDKLILEFLELVWKGGRKLAIDLHRISFSHDLLVYGKGKYYALGTDRSGYGRDYRVLLTFEEETPPSSPLFLLWVLQAVLRRQATDEQNLIKAETEANQKANLLQDEVNFWKTVLEPKKSAKS